jgi:charged multivesicular body protein 7
MQTPSTQSVSSSVLALPPYATTSASRLQSLYSDISRQKSSNPASYNANIEWWRRALEAVVGSGIQQSGSSLVLGAGPSLMDLLRVSGQKPLALAPVVVSFDSILSHRLTVSGLARQSSAPKSNYSRDQIS